jgi:hypothetical protein
MVPAYDDPLLWQGHASMVTEIHNQMRRGPGTISGLKPNVVVCSVGGGGLLGGILVGLKQVGWEDGSSWALYHAVPVLMVTNCSYCHCSGDARLRLLLPVHAPESRQRIRAGNARERW